MTVPDKAALLAEVLDGLQVQQPGDLTVADVIAASGRGHQWAIRRLEGMVTEGKLTKHHALLDTGRWGYVYRKVVDKGGNTWNWQS